METCTFPASDQKRCNYTSPVRKL